VDVVTIAKTAQAGATLFTEEYNPQPSLIAGTFAGSSVSLRAGHRILEVLDQQGFMGPKGKIAKIHQEFIGMLNRLNEGSCKGLLRDAGGLGLMVAVTPLDGSKEKQLELLKVLFKNGLLTFGCGKGPYRLRFLLPTVMTSEDIQRAEKIIEKSVLELA
jgi:acetylornithine/N-succinyldiaminopimelate aminotransferase